MEEDRETNDADRTISLGEKALGYIKYNQSSAAPEGYELWFNYASGLKPELNQKIKQLLSETPRISQEKLDELYSIYFINEDIGERMEQISSKVSDELSSIIETVGSSLSNTESYSESLEVFTSELSDIKDEGSLRMIISSMAAATFEMAQNTKELESNLSRSKDQIKELNQNIEIIRNESMTDALTGIANRKKFDLTIEKELNFARSENDTLSLLIADIDHFKNFNDTHGHQTGDQVLRLVASILKQNVKGRDLAARYGGEEFAIVLPQTSIHAAKIVADQVRNAVANKELVKKSTNTKLGRITLSVGAAELKADDTIESLIARADKCLYAAKDAGRNNVQTEDVLENSAPQVENPDSSAA